MTPIGTVTEIARAVATGERTAEAVLRECLDRIEAIDGRLHAFLHHDAQRAVARAREIDAARAGNKKLGPLAGVPIALKDNICTSLGPTTCGSAILSIPTYVGTASAGGPGAGWSAGAPANPDVHRDQGARKEPFCAGYDAHVVERLESAGAILIGKTNLDQFGMGSSTEHSARGPTCNPWDVGRVAGGSSGGSAAAVAAGMTPAALGSDTGGSIRQPAAFCGVAGVKPTYGRVSRYGLVAFGSSLDQIGPITRNVRDAALILGVIAGFDERDSTSVDSPVPDYLASLDRSLEGVRIGMIDETFHEGLEPEVASAITGAVEQMERAGARVVPIDLPHMKYAVACYYIIAPAEASSNLARFDGVHYGHRSDQPGDITNLYASSRAEGFGSEVKRRIMLGTYVLSSGYYEAYYLKALKVRTLIKRDLDRAFRSVDVIASPAAPTPAFRIGEKMNDPLAMYLSDIYTLAANLAGICAVSIPCGLTSAGLPIGLQLMGPAFGEERLLAVAHQYQQLTDHHTRLPPAATAA